MISLNTNLSSLILQQSLYKATLGLNDSILSLTTGYKVNHAKDNAANFSIINDLSTRISSMLQVQQNTENGISLLQTAEGGLDNILNLLSRIRTLAVEASNGTYDEQSLGALQNEADMLVEQIKNIKYSTEYDGMNLFETPNENNNISEPTTFNLTRENISEDANLTPASSTFTPTVGDETFSSPTVSSFAATPMRSAGVMPLAAGDTIEGAYSFSANQTRTVTIDGIQYTIKDLSGVGNDLSYTKDTSTGKLTFIGNNFEIRGQLDVAHNIMIAGKRNYIYTGNLNDTVEERDASSCLENRIYGGAGNDTLISRGNNSQIYGEDGDDILYSYNIANLYGGAGNDTLNIYSGNIGRTNDGGDGDDIFNINANYVNAKGGNGDDTFNIIGNRKEIIIDGGSGTNTVTGNVGTENTTINVVGANAGKIALVKNVAQTVEINGKNYTLSTAYDNVELTYKIESSGQITFTEEGNYLTIKADVNQSHNVKLLGNINYYGGDQGDTIKATSKGNATIYCGAGNNNITTEVSTVIYCQSGNNTITLNGNICRVYGDSGINNITVNSKHNYIQSSGNMSVTLNGHNNCVYGDGENNRIIANTGNNNFICGFGSADNAEGILYTDKNEHSITINGIEYIIRKRVSAQRALLYSVNNVTNEISFSGKDFDIRGEQDIAHNVNIYGQALYFYGGDLDDNVNVYGRNIFVMGGLGDDIISSYLESNYLYGEDGDDTINLNAVNSTIYGGNGNDTININASSTNLINGGLGDDIYNINAKITNLSDDGGNNEYNITTNDVVITGGSGNDTFYVTGNNNTVNGAGGNDYFVIDGNNNRIDGGSGTDYYILNGTNPTPTNATTDPTSGVLLFTAVGEEKTFTLDGKNYTVKNNGTANNQLHYSLNQNTHTITLEGDGFIVTSDDNQDNNLNIRGDNNIINGANLVDKITVEQGSRNIINGMGGNDILTSNSQNNSLFGGDGNDSIILNESTNLEINAGSGDDTITINADNCTNVKAENGNNTINLNGTNNTVKATTGNNEVNVNQNENNITLGNGNNNITVLSDNNTIITGNGNNSIGIQGSGNNITAQKSKDSVNIIGSDNTLTIVQGGKNISVKGDNNTVSSLIGDKNISVNGNENNITTGNGDDTFIINGDKNEVSAGSGNNSLNIKGNENEITTEDGDDIFTVKGNENSIETTDGNNEISIQGNQNEYQGGDGIDNIKISGNANIALGGVSSDSFMISSGNNNTIDGEDGDRNTMIDNGNNTTFANVVDITPRPFNLNIKVDIGSGEDKYISSKISFNLFDFKVDFSDQESARNCLETIDELIALVQDQLVNIGTSINRLSSAQEVQSIKLENMIASRSTLQDADIAKVSSQYIRNQILQQASATLLNASRNIRSDNIMALLYGIQR